MTIIQLEYLLAVANCGSFSLAAEHCFVTQPSLSMQVKALVVELDDERKAAMVSNLLVVLCGNRDAQPIVNSGSLY